MGQINWFLLRTSRQTKHDYFRKYLDGRLSFNGRNKRLCNVIFFL